MSALTYPTDIVTDSGRWERIHQGHDLDRSMLLADLIYTQGPRAEEVLHVEEVHLWCQPRVMWCGRHGDACDSEGEWHWHWHAIRPTSAPGTKFTLVRADMPS